jgi:hypothetical protein
METLEGLTALVAPALVISRPLYGEVLPPPAISTTELLKQEKALQGNLSTTQAPFRDPAAQTELLTGSASDRIDVLAAIHHIRAEITTTRRQYLGNLAFRGAIRLGR